MESLIDFSTEIEGRSLLSIVLNHCIHEIDMYFFKGMPKTYICNLQELAQELLTAGRFEEILYEKNRKPGESDPMRVENIINYQLANRVVNIESDTRTHLYDTADWKITFGIINGNPASIRIIDGGHRFKASLEIEKILSTIQILDFQSDEDMFEKFRIINVSSDLPEIYRLSPDDLYKKLTEMLISVFRNSNWFVKNGNEYLLNKNCGGGFSMPFLIEGDFSNFILKYKQIIFGNHIDLQGSLDDIIDKAIDVFATVNETTTNRILVQMERMGKFTKFSDFYATSSMICHGHNASQRKRCTNKAKVSHGCCGVHPQKIYTTPTFDIVVEEIRKSNCAIGLLHESEIVYKFSAIVGAKSHIQSH